MQTPKKLLGAAIERKPKIENVNVAGGRLIRESKVNFTAQALALSWRKFLFLPNLYIYCFLKKYENSQMLTKNLV